MLDNSLAWGGFVASSTNLRYQLVNGFEERALVSNSFIHAEALQTLMWHTGCRDDASTQCKKYGQFTHKMY